MADAATTGLLQGKTIMPGIPVINRGDIRWFRFAAHDKRRPVLVLGRSDVSRARSSAV